MRSGAMPNLPPSNTKCVSSSLSDGANSMVLGGKVFVANNTATSGDGESTKFNYIYIFSAQKVDVL